MKQFGIDVSELNGTLDYSKLKADGVQFVIIRAGYGQLESQRDAQLSQNLYGAMTAGMQIGIYWFSYAWNIETAIQEAELCAKVCNQYKSKISLPVFFDWEYASEGYAKTYHGVYADKTLVTDMTIAFINRIEELGYKGGYYTNEDYFARMYDAELMAGKNLWIAYYVDKKPDKYNCIIQQYRSDGTLKGVPGKFDFDYLYAETQSVPATPATPVTRTESITWGEVLSPIAQSHGATLDALLTLNGKQKFDVALTVKIPEKTIDELAREVIAGKWGYFPFRSARLKKAGYDPDAVQKRVNELL